MWVCGRVRNSTQGIRLERIKASRIVQPRLMRLSADWSRMTYVGAGLDCMIPVPDKAKSIDVSEIIETRCGWKSDNFGKQLRRKKQTFGNKYPVGVCTQNLGCARAPVLLTNQRLDIANQILNFGLLSRR